jgi:hypothetical protein
MNPLEAALRCILSDVEAGLAWWQNKDARGGQHVGCPPMLWQTPISALIEMRRTIRHALEAAGLPLEDAPITGELRGRLP